MSPSAVSSAEDIVNSWSEADLGRIFREYGEERAWRHIARKIVEVTCPAPLLSGTTYSNCGRLVFIGHLTSDPPRSVSKGPRMMIFDCTVWGVWCRCGRRSRSEQLCSLLQPSATRGGAGALHGDSQALSRYTRPPACFRSAEPVLCLSRVIMLCHACFRRRQTCVWIRCRRCALL